MERPNQKYLGKVTKSAPFEVWFNRPTAGMLDNTRLSRLKPTTTQGLNTRGDYMGL
jgi:hypothetical protein